MSLVVARKVAGNALIVADTHLVRSDRARVSPLEGTLKAIALNERHAVCFAGVDYWAEELVKSSHPAVDRDELIHRARELHLESNEATDFLILSQVSDSRYVIDIVRGSKVDRDVPEGWIGDPAAHQQFEEERINAQSEHSREGTAPHVSKDSSRIWADEVSSSMQAMKAVIDSSSSSSVGGFVVSVLAGEAGITYGAHFELYRGPFDLEAESRGQEVFTIEFKGVAEGSYAANVAGSVPGVFAVHMYQARLGVIFDSRPGRQPTTTTYKEHDEIDFQMEVLDPLGIGLSMTVESTAAHHGAKGVEAIESGRLESAERLLTRSVRLFSRGWGPVPSNDQEFESVNAAIAVNGTVELPNADRQNTLLTLRHRADLRWRMNRPEIAIDDARDLLFLDPGNLWGTFHLAKWLALTGKLEDGLAVLQHLEHFKPSASLLHLRCMIHHELGDVRSAVNDARDALRLQADFKEAKAYLTSFAAPREEGPGDG